MDQNGSAAVPNLTLEEALPCAGFSFFSKLIVRTGKRFKFLRVILNILNETKPICLKIAKITVFNDKFLPCLTP